MTDAITDAGWRTSLQDKRNARLNDPRSRAIDALIRAGRNDEVKEIIDKASTRAQGTYRQIEDDTSRSDEWKDAEIDRAYQSTKTALTDELVRRARSAELDDERDASRVFGVAGLPGDTGSLAISARDAADRVASTAAEDLRDLLDRATRTGDEVLARAVVQRAIEERNAAVVNDFTDRRPELREPTERLWERSRRGDQAAMQSAMRTLGIAPMRRMLRSS